MNVNPTKIYMYKGENGIPYGDVHYDISYQEFIEIYLNDKGFLETTGDKDEVTFRCCAENVYDFIVDHSDEDFDIENGAEFQSDIKGYYYVTRCSETLEGIVFTQCELEGAIKKYFSGLSSEHDFEGISLYYVSFDAEGMFKESSKRLFSSHALADFKLVDMTIEEYLEFVKFGKSPILALLKQAFEARAKERLMKEAENCSQ